jgi:hypothetical protein
MMTQLDTDAATLAAAAAVMRRRFGGLQTTIAVLDEKAAVLGARSRDPRLNFVPAYPPLSPADEAALRGSRLIQDHEDAVDAARATSPTETENPAMTPDQLAAMVLAQTREVLRAKGYDSQIDREKVQVVPGPKYTRIDRGPHGTSGFLMIENATGVIYGIKGYGRVHKGHRYGTLATADQWFWGEYHPRQAA